MSPQKEHFIHSLATDSSLPYRINQDLRLKPPRPIHIRTYKPKLGKDGRDGFVLCYVSHDMSRLSLLWHLVEQGASAHVEFTKRGASAFMA